MYSHKVQNRKVPLVRGFDDYFLAPHSRHTYIKTQDIKDKEDLKILAESKEVGVLLASNKGGRQIFITGHLEYDNDTLLKEYQRDVLKGLEIEIPKNYFPDDDPKREPVVTWRGHANLIYSNWLNYFVYQNTPYDITEIKAE